MGEKVAGANGRENCPLTLLTHAMRKSTCLYEEENQEEEEKRRSRSRRKKNGGNKEHGETI